MASDILAPQPYRPIGRYSMALSIWAFAPSRPKPFRWTRRRSIPHRAAMDFYPPHSYRRPQTRHGPTSTHRGPIPTAMGHPDAWLDNR